MIRLLRNFLRNSFRNTRKARQIRLQKRLLRVFAHDRAENPVIDSAVYAEQRWQAFLLGLFQYRKVVKQ